MSHTNYVPNLGELCKADARRDAVHIAVAPVVAGECLNPSERVILNPEGKAFTRHIGGPSPVGIVDPYLEDCVVAGETFWLFLFPGTITGLRHVWSHPAFKAKIPEVPNES
jgi:hypothetical protein